jgi:hypothetical protein
MNLGQTPERTKNESLKDLKEKIIMPEATTKDRETNAAYIRLQPQGVPRFQNRG